MGTLTEDLNTRGFAIRTFDSPAAFVEAMPIPVSDTVLEGRLFATRRLEEAEVFVLEYQHRDKVATYDQPVRRLVHLRHPALTGTALVSPTFWRAFITKGGWLFRAILLLLMVLLAIPLLLLLLLSMLLRIKDPRTRIKFGGAFDRQFKVISRDEASARALLTEPLRRALLASDLVDSLDFNNGLTVVSVGQEQTLKLTDELQQLVGGSTAR